MIKSQNKSKKLNQQEISKEKFNLEEVPKKLLEITKKTNKFEAFVDSITLLHQASMCADLILKICVDQYSSLPDENKPMQNPNQNTPQQSDNPSQQIQSQNNIQQVQSSMQPQTSDLYGNFAGYLFIAIITLLGIAYLTLKNKIKDLFQK